MGNNPPGGNLLPVNSLSGNLFAGIPVTGNSVNSNSVISNLADNNHFDGFPAENVPDYSNMESSFASSLQRVNIRIPLARLNPDVVPPAPLSHVVSNTNFAQRLDG